MITADQVPVIGKIIGPRAVALAAGRGIDLPEAAGVMVRFAATQPHEDLTKLVHTFLERLDVDGPEPDPTDQRFGSIARHADGSATGRLHLDPMGTEKLSAALESLLQADRPAGDTRPPAQQRADALVQLCDIHLGCGTVPLLRGVEPHSRSSSAPTTSPTRPPARRPPTSASGASSPPPAPAKPPATPSCAAS